jgi:hypothetical protein
MQPDIFVVIEDGHTPEKAALCIEVGGTYVILQRNPHPGLEARSTTSLRNMGLMPCRIDVAGGWLDQPWVSKYYPGPVITISLEPTVKFKMRSGMATSTARVLLIYGGRNCQLETPKNLPRSFFVMITRLERKRSQAHKIQSESSFLG